MFSPNAFAILDICYVRTHRLIPSYLTLNAKFTSSLVFVFTSLEAAQSSRMISAFFSLAHMTGDLEQIIHLILEWSQYEEVFVTFSEAIVCLFVNECRTEEEDVVELSSEGSAEEIDRISAQEDELH